jgi:hypothetical protein
VENLNWLDNGADVSPQFDGYHNRLENWLQPGELAAMADGVTG